MAPARVPAKRILGEATNTRRNIPSSPTSAKKRKLEPTSSPAARFKSTQHGSKGKVGSTQPSHFESEVLEKMTQDMAGLKKNNSEKDQAWARPSLDDFNSQTDNLCFQQIECEEGTFGDGGKACVKLFGVTEVSAVAFNIDRLLIRYADGSFCYVTCNRLSALFVHRCSGIFYTSRLRRFQDISRGSDCSASTSHTICSSGDARESLWIPRKSTKSIYQDHRDGSEVHKQGSEYFRNWKYELEGDVERGRWYNDV